MLGKANHPDIVPARATRTDASSRHSSICDCMTFKSFFHRIHQDCWTLCAWCRGIHHEQPCRVTKVREQIRLLCGKLAQILTGITSRFTGLIWPSRASQSLSGLLNGLIGPLRATTPSFAGLRLQPGALN